MEIIYNLFFKRLEKKVLKSKRGSLGKLYIFRGSYQIWFYADLKN